MNTSQLLWRGLIGLSTCLLLLTYAFPVAAQPPLRRDRAKPPDTVTDSALQYVFSSNTPDSPGC